MGVGCRAGPPLTKTLSALSGIMGSGYNLARMRFEILLAPEAVEDLRKLKAGERAAVKEALETHLRHEPTKTSRSRIKRLRGVARPQYRLRVEEVRVFYDVSSSTVEVLAIVPKPEAESWLEQFGSSK
jgi:mRNA-degrading endonuclease RelE of RelBE toxin-antitoxin system